MGMGNFSLSWVCHPLDTTDWGEEDPAFWKLPNESRAIFKLLKSHWTKNSNHKRKACLSFLRWFMVPHVMHWQHFCITTRAGAHRQCSCMYHKGRCALTMFLYVPWGQEHTDNVSVCIMRASTHWQCFYMYHKGRCALTMFLYVSQGRCTLTVFLYISQGRCILTMFLYVSWGQMCTGNVSVCIMRAGAHWQCFCMYHKLLWVVSESNLRVRSIWLLAKNKKFLRLLNIFIINTCFDMSWL